MKTRLPLQNIHCEGCFRNVEAALRLCEGVTAVTLDRCRLEAIVEFDSPATIDLLRAELELGGYLGKAEDPLPSATLGQDRQR